MPSKVDVEKIFNGLKYACSWISAILFVWLFCHLFIPSWGGPFPYRTRGPLAKEEYKQLGELDEWESVLDLPALEDKTASEALIQGDEIPPLEFGSPNSVTKEKE